MTGRYVSQMCNKGGGKRTKKGAEDLLAYPPATRVVIGAHIVFNTIVGQLASNVDTHPIIP
jgi:hypothetical protein